MEAEKKSEVLVESQPTAPDQAVIPFVERRTTPRHSVDVEASILLLKHGSRFNCHLNDLSMTGCRLQSKVAFQCAAFTRVEVNFRLLGLMFRFCGVVQWTDGKRTVGIRFSEMTSRRREELSEVLAEVQAANAAKAAEEAAKKAAEELAARQQAEEERVAEEQAAKKQAEAKARIEADKPDWKLVGDQLVAEERPAGFNWQTPEQAPEIALQESLQDLESEAELAAWLPTEEQIAALAVPTATPTEESAAQKSVSRSADDLLTELFPIHRPLAGRLQPTQPASVNLTPAEPSVAKRKMRERRVDQRMNVDTSAVIFLLKIGSRIDGRILDISLNGCRIRTNQRFPVGIYTRVETEFRLEGLPFRLGGVVQSLHDQNQVGIRFLDLSERKREQVQQLIDEIAELREFEKSSEGESSSKDHPDPNASAA